METQDRTREWYEQYYAKNGADRNDPLNPEVMLQAQAMQLAVLRVFRTANLNRQRAKILDVGCGSGDSLVLPLSLKFRPGNLHGLDILADRIAVARLLHPGMKFFESDAAAMPFQDGSFDMVMAFTMFVQLTDPALSERIAREMWRVVKPGGYVMLVDWRYGKPWSRDYFGVSKGRIRTLFPHADHVTRERGALIPPVGRVLSRYLPSLYFPTQAIFPALVGSMATLLQRPLT
jgi:ubiquinone/menaquinone biosynthesis C-methylase UbiE